MWRAMQNRAMMRAASTETTLRFEHVSASDSSLVVHLVGAAHETVHVCATRMASGEARATVCKDVVFGAAGGWRLLSFEA